jgi:hypothetical protein
MNSTSGTALELRIARAYVKLWCIPEESSEASVLLASIGSYEIRMFRGPEVDFDGLPLFWLELFDHSTKKSVDGFSCHRIKDAVPIFDDFISQGDRLNKSIGRGDEGIPDPSKSSLMRACADM